MARNGTGISYRQHQIAEAWDAVVIGSGMGGLTTAALLAKHTRLRVLVLERHYTAGGYTHSFSRPGFDWDVGVHYIGQVHDPDAPLRRASDHLTEGRLEWRRVPDVYDRAIIAGHEYEFVSGEQRFRERMKEYFPREGRAIDAYVDAVKSCARMSGLYFAEKAIPRPAARIAGGLMRSPFLRWAGRTTAQVLGGLTDNRELIAVLTAQWGDYGLPPAQSSFGIHATIAHHFLEGAAYPVGGAAQIAASVAPVIERAGGKIVVGAEVSEVLVENGKASGVRMSDGKVFRAPRVISDAGAGNTLGSLLRSPAPGVEGILEEIRRLPPSMAYMTLYVGLDGAAAELDLKGANIWVHPTANHDGNLARFSEDFANPFPFLFISFPSAKDPDFEQRHPGHATVEVVTPVPYDWFRNWQDTRWKRRGAEYEEMKARFSRRLLAELECYVPAVRGRIVHAELSTPVTARHFMNYARGEAYGIAATPERFRLRALAPRTPVPGLYLTGQDVAMPGVTGALFGGALAASAVLGKNMISKMTARSRTLRAPTRRPLLSGTLS